jgi:hypothetical protein
MVMCISNNAVINNNCGRLQDLILILGIPMGTRKNAFVIYRQFGHAPSKKFASYEYIDRRVYDGVPVFDGEQLHGMQSIEG